MNFEFLKLCYLFIREHVRSHTGEKPFHCDVCLRQFSLASAFRIHKRTHTGERPFECSRCHKVIILNVNNYKYLNLVERIFDSLQTFIKSYGLQVHQKSMKKCKPSDIVSSATIVQLQITPSTRPMK